MSDWPDLLHVRCPKCGTTGIARWVATSDSGTYLVDCAHTDARCPYIGMPDALDVSREAPNEIKTCDVDQVDYARAQLAELIKALGALRDAPMPGGAWTVGEYIGEIIDTLDEARGFGPCEVADAPPDN